MSDCRVNTGRNEIAVLAGLTAYDVRRASYCSHRKPAFQLGRLSRAYTDLYGHAYALRNSKSHLGSAPLLSLGGPNCSHA